MSLQKEIQKLELEIMNSLGAREAYKNLSLLISKVPQKNISKKSLLESLTSLEKQSIEARLRAEGALNLARKLEKGEEKTPKKVYRPHPEQEEGESFDEEMEDSEESGTLDDNIKNFYGLEEEEEEDEL